MAAPSQSLHLPIVFLGPSLSLHEALTIVDADFRPPCRRGDFNEIPVGAIVGLVDGVFNQDDAVSPREIVFALQRGITILGGSSMGALRAAEIPGVQGVGRIYEMYRLGAIDEDDEVAVLFDPKTFTPCTVPLVNVRYAVERLLQTGSILPSMASRILEAARKLNYTERTYKNILAQAGLASNCDSEDLLHLLASFDLKGDDTRLLLERLSTLARTGVPPLMRTDAPPIRPDYGVPDNFTTKQARRKLNVDAPVHIWETGDTVAFQDLVMFLKLTGKFDTHASNAVTLMLTGDHAGHGEKFPLGAKRDFRGLSKTWGWRTSDEQQVTLLDLGLPRRHVLADLGARRRLRDIFTLCARTLPESFLEALRCELFANDMALKRETMRCGSLQTMSPIEKNLKQDVDKETTAVMCRLHGTDNWSRLQRRLSDLGLENSSIQKFGSEVRSVRETAKAMLSPALIAPEIGEQDRAFGLSSSVKPPATDRFSTNVAEAYSHAVRLKSVVGVTRIGMIASLAELDGVYVSQAARPSGAWSSTYGSGKSDSKEGAITGGVMEEVEKWAQEQFAGQPIVCSYSELGEREEHTINPRNLDLPYDSTFTEGTALPWHRCTDLIQGSFPWVPLAAIACPFHAGKNNPFYSARGARVVFSTNGLASGFTLAEAVVHAVCECIERHTTRICDLHIENPGLTLPRNWPRRIDLETLPPRTQWLIERLREAKCEISLWDITAGIRVPTLMARVTRDFRLAEGWATHPNPGVAGSMALLEACQTLASQVAAGREDLSVQARSLGRHERTRPLRRSVELFWQNHDSSGASVAEVQGFVTNNIFDEFTWIRERLAQAGIRNLITVDLTRSEIAPAHVVRVLIPGLETTNPFYCGPRARLALISDIVFQDSQISIKF
jgi:ribosomal protein S12 methylthiotransferase accessory factor